MHVLQEVDVASSCGMLVEIPLDGVGLEAITSSLDGSGNLGQVKRASPILVCVNELLLHLFEPSNEGTEGMPVELSSMGLIKHPHQ